MTLTLTRSGDFAGYASLFNVRDQGGDIILPGAFRETLARRGPRGVRMLWQHDAARPLGVWLSLREDARGLFAKGRLAMTTSAGREAAALLRAGALDGLSIGFRTLRARRDSARKARLVYKLDLWEISLVTFPMLPGARVGNVKTMPPSAVCA